jgi:hypothetical protein
MSMKYYITCLWPGLAELWWRGRLSAIPTALAFAAALNLMLVMQFLYSEWLDSSLVKLGCWVGVAVWLFFVTRAIRELPDLIAPRTVSDEPDRFPEARDACLRSDWSEAEGLLSDVLAIEPRDPPALLLLCSVYRSTGRLEAATQLIEEIRRLEVADTWWLEIAAEERRIERMKEADQESDANTDSATETNEGKSKSADMTEGGNSQGEPLQAAA